MRGKTGKIVTLVAISLLCAGLYLLSLVAAPQLMMPARPATWAVPIPDTTNQLTENRLYIPRLKLTIAFAPGSADVLESGAWHRFPERGDPQHGGNFILAAHRLEIGHTPAATVRQSPFYHLDLVQIDDPVFVDFAGVRYKYQITSRQTVKPDQVEIEAPTATPRLTLYTCTLKGQQDGREVLFAKLVAKDVDPALAL